MDPPRNTRFDFAPPLVISTSVTRSTCVEHTRVLYAHNKARWIFLIEPPIKGRKRPDVALPTNPLLTKREAADKRNRV